MKRSANKPKEYVPRQKKKKELQLLIDPSRLRNEGVSPPSQLVPSSRKITPLKQRQLSSDPSESINAESRVEATRSTPHKPFSIIDSTTSKFKSRTDINYIFLNQNVSPSNFQPQSFEVTSPTKMQISSFRQLSVFKKPNQRPSGLPSNRRSNMRGEDDSTRFEYSEGTNDHLPKVSDVPSSAMSQDQLETTQILERNKPVPLMTDTAPKCFTQSRLQWLPQPKMKNEVNLKDEIKQILEKIDDEYRDGESIMRIYEKSVMRNSTPFQKVLSTGLMPAKRSQEKIKDASSQFFSTSKGGFFGDSPTRKKKKPFVPPRANKSELAIPVIDKETEEIGKVLDQSNDEFRRSQQQWNRVMQKGCDARNPYIMTKKMTQNLMQKIEQIRHSHTTKLRNQTQSQISSQKETQEMKSKRNTMKSTSIIRQDSNMGNHLEKPPASPKLRGSIISSKAFGSQQEGDMLSRQGGSTLGMINSGKPKVQFTLPQKSGEDENNSYRALNKDVLKDLDEQSISQQEIAPAKTQAQKEAALTAGLSISQFRAKKVEEINPFFTYFNQSQTHNKFHKSPIDTQAEFDLVDKYQNYLDQETQDKVNFNMRKNIRDINQIGIGRGHNYQVQDLTGQSPLITSSDYDSRYWSPVATGRDGQVNITTTFQTSQSGRGSHISSHVKLEKNQSGTVAEKRIKKLASVQQNVHQNLEMIARFKVMKLIDYKYNLGLAPHQSILEDPDIRASFSDTKAQIEREFKKANLDVHFDFDKKVFLDEMVKHLEVALPAYHNKQIDTFNSNMLAMSYLSILKKEYQFTMKLYNVLGHVYMTWKEFHRGYDCFKKLKDVAKMAHDLETSMYALKQMGYCLHQIKDYSKALKCFKCQLQIAWHINHNQGEISSYENLGLTNFYLGRIEKSEYYMDRVSRGKTEAMFSGVKKISLAYTRRKYKNILQTNFKSDIAQNMARRTMKASKVSQAARTREIFSLTFQDYNIFNDETLKNLGYLRRKTEQQENQNMVNDPTAQYIDPGTPVSQMSDRNLPSPSEVRGHAHILLMPFFQELERDENRMAHLIHQNNLKIADKKRRAKELERRNRQLIKQQEREQRLQFGEDESGEKKGRYMSSSSESSADSDDFLGLGLNQQNRKNMIRKGKKGTTSKSTTAAMNYAVTRDDVFIYELDPKKQKQLKGYNPMSAYYSKLDQQSKMQARIDQIRNEERMKKRHRIVQNSSLGVPLEKPLEPIEEVSTQQMMLMKARKMAPMLISNPKRSESVQNNDHSRLTGVMYDRDLRHIEEKVANFFKTQPLIDMNAIKSKAISRHKPDAKRCKLYLNHMSSQRQSKYQKEIEDSRIEQVKKSLLHLKIHIYQELERVFYRMDPNQPGVYKYTSLDYGNVDKFSHL